MTAAFLKAPSLLRSCLLATASGLLLSAAFEPLAFGWLIPFAVAGFVLSIRGVRLRVAWLPGLLFGLAFQSIALVWILQGVSLMPWVAVVFVEAAFYVFIALLFTALSKQRLWPLWFAVIWTAAEVMRGLWPVGGLTWGRLSYGVINTPLDKAMPYAGSLGLTFILALLGALVAWFITAKQRERVWVGACIAVLLALCALPSIKPYKPHQLGTKTVAVVQGDVPGKGNDVRNHYREVTANHSFATQQLAAAVKSGVVQKPAFVVWPENSTAVDPFKDTITNRDITQAVSAIQVPILVGAITDAGSKYILNQGIVWNPDNSIGDRYTKHHPVPFGEYLPLRKYIKGNFTGLSQLTRDMLPGTSVDPITIAGTKVANSICFDIDYDSSIYQQVSHGAQLLTVQSSNALFISTHQLDQQFSITRLRAMETGRWAVVATINGISGIIAPDGRIVNFTERHTQSTIVEQVGLIDSITPAVRLSTWVGRVCIVLTLVGLAYVITRRLKKS